MMKRVYPLEQWVEYGGVDTDEEWAVVCDDCGKTLVEDFGDDVLNWVLRRGRNKFICPYCGECNLLAVYHP